MNKIINYPPETSVEQKKKEVKMIKYPPWLPVDQRETWENSTVKDIIERGMRRVNNNPKLVVLPGIFDANDQLSVFMQGVLDGLYRVDWGKGDPIEYLINSGIWRLRTTQYRAMNKKFIIRCMCGTRLRIGQIPCHYKDGSVNNTPQTKRDPKATEKGGNVHVMVDDGRQIIVAELATDVIEQYSDQYRDRHNGEPFSMSLFNSI